jgi:hypothetical protein
MGRQYTCSMCEGIYEAEWTEEEALAERDILWGDVSIEDCDVVCDDCFKLVTGGANADVMRHFNQYHNPHTKGELDCQMEGCAWRA